LTEPCKLAPLAVTAVALAVVTVGVLAVVKLTTPP